jgi:hypothetical protein
MKSKSILSTCVIFTFALLSVNPAYSATTLLNKKCSKINATTSNAGKKLVCASRSGKKIWVLATVTKPTITGTPSAEPSPIPTPIFLPAITNLSANITGSVNTYTFSKPSSISDEVTYELGLSYLLNPTYDIVLYSSYSEIITYKTFSSSPISITLNEMRSFVLANRGMSDGISVMARVRVVTPGSKSAWSNGIYNTSAQINYSQVITPVPTPTYTPIPIPIPTYTRTPIPTYTPAPVPTPTYTPTPAPTKTLRTFTITANRRANCADQNINSTLTSASLITMPTGGTGSAKYIYKPGMLTRGSYGAEVSAGIREYWVKATFESPFVYQRSEPWYADVQITCSYYQ